MSTKHILKAEKRETFGKALAQHRALGKIPGNIYGNIAEPLAVWFEKKELETLLKDVSESALIDVMVGSDKTRPSIMRDIQYNVVKKDIVHIDLQQVNLKEKIQVAIPIEFTGESKLAESGDAVVDTHLSEIEIEALPTDLPESFTVDISQLVAIGDKIIVGDLKVGKEIEILTDKEESIVALIEPQKQEEDATVSEAEQVSEVETTEEANPEAEETK